MKHNPGFLYSGILVCTFETDPSGCFIVLCGKLLPHVPLLLFSAFIFLDALASALYIRFSSSESEAIGIFSYSFMTRYPNSEESANWMIFCRCLIISLASIMSLTLSTFIDSKLFSTSSSLHKTLEIGLNCFSLLLRLYLGKSLVVNKDTYFGQLPIITTVLISTYLPIPFIKSAWLALMALLTLSVTICSICSASITECSL